MEDTSGQYKQVVAILNEWLVLHKGETFDLDIICRHLEITKSTNRNYVTIELSKLVHKAILEKTNKYYRYIDNTIENIDWLNTPDEEVFSLTFPQGRSDSSRFDFEENVIVSPGDIIVIAGMSNMGKTAFCINLLWENMDKYPCTLMGNEYTPVKFRRRVKRMDWADPVNGDGQPKFELINRRDGWKDIIRPDNINIIDWINLGDNFYQIGMIIDGIQSKLRKGIAVISIQKAPDKTRGLGGGFSEHLASLYLSIDYERLTVIKVKEWYQRNPNNDVYGFSIVDGGAKFHNIRRMKKCPKCYGTGHSKGSECDDCFGKGFIDK